MDPRSLTVAAVSLTFFGCSVPSTNSPLIKKYAEAECVPLSEKPKLQAYTREWDSVLTLGDGSLVKISGAQMPGVRIGLDYGGSEKVVSATVHLDYVYPADVRVDRQNELLYVKTSGLAGGIRHETWLYEFDLRQRRINRGALVADRVLPRECIDPRRP